MNNRGIDRCPACGKFTNSKNYKVINDIKVYFCKTHIDGYGAICEVSNLNPLTHDFNMFDMDAKEKQNVFLKPGNLE